MADIFTTILNGIQKKFADLGTHHAEVVVVVNEDGSPIGGGSTAGLALEATQQQVRDRLPAALVGDRLKVTSQDTNGEGAVTYITNTTAVTGLAARQVVCLTDTVFATFTRTGATGGITGVSLPAGTLLTGPVTAITLTSGTVAAYA